MTAPKPSPGKEIVTIHIEVPVGFRESRDKSFWTNVELVVGLLMRLSNGRVHPTVWREDT